MRGSIEIGRFLLMHHLYKSDNHHCGHVPLLYTPTLSNVLLYDVLSRVTCLDKVGYADDERTRSGVHLLCRS